MKILVRFETTRTRVIAIDSLTSQLGEEIYIIESVDLKTNKINVRFGNHTQMVSIIKTYRYGLKRQYKEQYEAFLKEKEAQ